MVAGDGTTGQAPPEPRRDFNELGIGLEALASNMCNLEELTCRKVDMLIGPQAADDTEKEAQATASDPSGPSVLTTCTDNAKAIQRYLSAIMAHIERL